jgi:16S rRNA (cytosine967-C5)-methyltransferase
MKFYASQVEAIITALQGIFTEGQYADRTIQQVLKADSRRGSRDRAFIAENTYEIVRWYRWLVAVTDRGTPESTADWWRIFGVHLILAGKKLPPWREFTDLDPVAIRQRAENLRNQRALRESIPDWLEERGRQELGDRWGPTLAALNKPASVVLRTNTLQTTVPQLIESLARDKVAAEPLAADAVRIIDRKNLFRTHAFRRGWFEIQDWSSQQVAPLLAVAPGQRVVDACAGAGGKSLHLASLMNNQGSLIALDTEAWKLGELRKRARRNRIHIIDTRPITSTKVVKRLYGSADRLLLDVPCSGLGVLRRNPDAKWKLSPEFIDRVRKIQAGVLQRYPKMLKPGGRMVYATCSVLPSENSEQVREFLASEAGADFTLTEERTILPQDEGFDGFYLAALTKKA